MCPQQGLLTEKASKIADQFVNPKGESACSFD